MNSEIRVVVENTDGLYYTVTKQESHDGSDWFPTSNGEMVHENQLENTIATIFRGPSIVHSAKRIGTECAHLHSIGTPCNFCDWGK